MAGAEHSPGHVVSSPIEHPAIAEPVARLEAAGFAVDRRDVSAEGLADVEAMAGTFRDDTRFALSRVEGAAPRLSTGRVRHRAGGG